MFKTILDELVPSVLALLVLTVITGFAYPALITVAGQAIFPHQANGSLIKSAETTKGSELIGQPFSDAKYFWGRPSATGPFAFNAAASSGANQGPTNPALLDAVKSRIAALQAADPDNKDPVPVDLVTASGSGLDPHISPAAAQYQVARVVKARSAVQPALTVGKVQELVNQFTEGRQLGILGEARVNVLKLNLALDQ